MKAKLFDANGLCVHVIANVGKRPPPDLRWADRALFRERNQPSFIEPKLTLTTPVFGDVRHFTFVGLAVDVGGGTCAHYIETGKPPILDPDHSGGEDKR